MDSFLDQMQKEGVPQSEGTFTLAEDKAHWKMSRYRLANRSGYAAHVLAAAVAGGADRFELVTEGDLVRMEWNGAPYLADDFTTLADPTSVRTRRLEELEIALSALIGHCTVRFQAIGPKMRRELQVVVGEISLSQLPPTEDERHVLIIESPLSEEDIRRFVLRTQYAPLQLIVNGKEVNRPLDFGRTSGLARGVWSVYGAEALRVGERVTGTEAFYGSRESREGPSLLLCLREPRWSGYEKVLLLSHGVVVHEEAGFFGFPMLTGAVTTGHLTRDLSAQGLVRNEKWEEFLEWVRLEVDRFLAAFCEHPPQTRKVFDRVFRMELRKYYAGREMPPSVTAYLDHGRGLKVSKETAKLDEAVADARKSGSDVYLKRLEAALVFEVEKAVSGQDFEEAASWNTAHSYLRSRAAWPTGRNTAIDRWFSFLRRAEVDANWAQETLLNMSLRPSDRYRAALLLLSHSSWKEHESVVEQLSVPDVWREPLLIFSNARPERFEESSWHLTSELLFGDVGQFLQHFIQAGDIASTERAAWLELLARTRAGQLAWKEQIRLTALRSTSWVKTPGSVKREFLEHLKMKDAARKPPIKESRFFRLPESQELHLPIMVYQCWLAREAGPAWQKFILARALMMQSLRSLASDTELGAELPPRPF